VRSDSPIAGIAGLFPGYPALVMATGIVAIAAHEQDLDLVASALYAVAAAAYVVIMVLVLVRLTAFSQRLIADLTSHARGFAFLTITAGSNVLGSASGLIHGWWGLAWALWWIGIVTWVVLGSTTLIAVVLREEKPGLGAGINGTWFLLIVSTQSVAVLGALLLGRGSGDGLAFLVLAAFTLGIALYLIIMTLVFLRWTFQRLDASEIDPPAWIAAGAVAITVLAGSNILVVRDAAERLERTAGFVEGMVVMAWTIATFWLPLMVAIGVWRHIVKRVPLRYHPSYWSLVFPLGMYSVATTRMRSAMDLAGLGWLPTAMFGVAIAAWALAFVGLLHQFGSAALARARPE
jgi:tellurite resistance protein TehA-like permease